MIKQKLQGLLLPIEERAVVRTEPVQRPNDQAKKYGKTAQRPVVNKGITPYIGGTAGYRPSISS